MEQVAIHVFGTYVPLAVSGPFENSFTSNMVY